MKTKEEIQRDRVIILLRAARKARGMTLTELSNKIYVSPSALSKFENGHLFNLDHVESYRREVLNDAERATLDELMKGGL